MSNLSKLTRKPELPSGGARNTSPRAVQCFEDAEVTRSPLTSTETSHTAPCLCPDKGDRSKEIHCLPVIL